VTEYLKHSVPGCLMEKELQVFLPGAIDEPKRPLAAIVALQR